MTDKHPNAGTGSGTEPDAGHLTVDPDATPAGAGDEQAVSEAAAAVAQGRPVLVVSHEAPRRWTVSDPSGGTALRVCRSRRLAQFAARSAARRMPGGALVIDDLSENRLRTLVHSDIQRSSTWVLCALLGVYAGWNMWTAPTLLAGVEMVVAAVAVLLAGTAIAAMALWRRSHAEASAGIERAQVRLLMGVGLSAAVTMAAMLLAFSEPRPLRAALAGAVVFFGSGAVLAVLGLVVELHHLDAGSDRADSPVETLGGASAVPEPVGGGIEVEPAAVPEGARQQPPAAERFEDVSG